jgi:hypothetical protein
MNSKLSKLSTLALTAALVLALLGGSAAATPSADVTAQTTDDVTNTLDTDAHNPDCPVIITGGVSTMCGGGGGGGDGCADPYDACY